VDLITRVIKYKNHAKKMLTWFFISTDFFLPVNILIDNEDKNYSRDIFFHINLRPPDSQNPF